MAGTSLAILRRRKVSIAGIATSAFLLAQSDHRLLRRLRSLFDRWNYLAKKGSKEHSSAIVVQFLCWTNENMEPRKSSS
jgi:hypothetical protein